MTKSSQRHVEQYAIAHGFRDFQWISPGEIVTAQWVRNKCLFGCPSYGRKACCPPETPSLGDCRNFFGEYRKGLLFHIPKKFADPRMRHEWNRQINAEALAFERDVFLAGFHKAFLFVPAPCNICSECRGRKSECSKPAQARPTLEAFCVDVFATAQKFGYPIQVLKDYKDETNRYGALLAE